MTRGDRIIRVRMRTTILITEKRRGSLALAPKYCAYRVCGDKERVSHGSGPAVLGGGRNAVREFVKRWRYISKRKQGNASRAMKLYARGWSGGVLVCGLAQAIERLGGGIILLYRTGKKRLISTYFAHCF